MPRLPSQLDCSGSSDKPNVVAQTKVGNGKPPTEVAMDCSDSSDMPIRNGDTHTKVDNAVPPTEVVMKCSDPLSVAMQKLETIANQNGFAISDMPADGDCMLCYSVPTKQCRVV